MQARLHCTHLHQLQAVLEAARRFLPSETRTTSSDPDDKQEHSCLSSSVQGSAAILILQSSQHWHLPLVDTRTPQVPPRWNELSPSHQLQPAEKPLPLLLHSILDAKRHARI